MPVAASDALLGLVRTVAMTDALADAVRRGTLDYVKDMTVQHHRRLHKHRKYQQCDKTGFSCPFHTLNSSYF